MTLCWGPSHTCSSLAPPRRFPCVRASIRIGISKQAMGMCVLGTVVELARTELKPWKETCLTGSLQEGLLPTEAPHAARASEESSPCVMGRDAGACEELGLANRCWRYLWFPRQRLLWDCCHSCECQCTFQWCSKKRV